MQRKPRNPYTPRITASINNLSNDDDFTITADDITPEAFTAVIVAVSARPSVVTAPTCVICRVVRPDDCIHPFSECTLL